MDIGKTLIIFGTLIVAIGIAFTIFEKAGIPRLPGDILIKGEKTTFYFPIVTSIVISIVLTLILNIFFKK